MSDARRGDVIGIVVSAVLALLAYGLAAACPPPGKIWDLGGIIVVTITAPAHNSMVAAGSNVTCTANASDPDHWTKGTDGGTAYDDFDSYTWSAKRNNSDVGTFPNPNGNRGSSVTWQAPDSIGYVTITCTVNDVGKVELPDGGSRDDQPGSASVTVEVINLDLWYGGACVTDETQDTIVGRKVLMYALVSPEDVEVTAQQWSVPGHAIANYTADENSATVTPLSGLSGSNMVGYYWVDGGDGRDVTYTATVGGQQFAVKTTFNVKRPTASITTTTSSVNCNKDYGAWWLFFGTYGTPGIVFEKQVTEPTGFEGGSTKWVQVVSSILRRLQLTQGEAWHRLSGSNICDGAYPYPGGDTADDNPGQKNLNDNLLRATADDAYTMYLMYTPTGTAIEVPLRKVYWSWWGAASRVGEDEWELDLGGRGVVRSVASHMRSHRRSKP